MNNGIRVTDYLGETIQCECGKTHSADIERIEISAGALGKVPKFIHEDRFIKPFIVMDRNTYSVAGKQLQALMSEEQINFVAYTFDDEQLVPDEHALGKLFMNYDEECDLIIGVGSGTINDICRFVSHRLSLPYYIVATAPSMDGYASTVAPLIRNNLKTTFECHAPYAIIADLNVVAKAPREMVAAGYGDVLGKYTCLADWKLSAIINGEYYCEKVAGLTRQSLERTIELSAGIAQGDAQAIGELMETLILSGIAMSYVGNSRPASGSEHHLAHFWEMRLLWEGRQPVLHGTKVGISTTYILKLYHYLLNEKLNPEYFQSLNPPISENWVTEISKVFLDVAPEILLLEAREKKNDPTLHRDRLKTIINHWSEILETLQTVPSPEMAIELLQSVHAPTDPSQVGIESQLVYDAILYAKEIRPRYTILQLLWDLDLLSTFAKRIVP